MSFFFLFEFCFVTFVCQIFFFFQLAWLVLLKKQIDVRIHLLNGTNTLFKRYDVNIPTSVISQVCQMFFFLQLFVRYHHFFFKINCLIVWPLYTRTTSEYRSFIRYYVFRPSFGTTFLFCLVLRWNISYVTVFFTLVKLWIFHFNEKQ